MTGAAHRADLGLNLIHRQGLAPGLCSAGSAIETQKKTGVKVRYTDKGHQVEAVFYSPDGSAMQLRDTAKLTREVLDGDKVIRRDDVAAHYVVIMAVTEERWKVRSIAEVPNF